MTLPADFVRGRFALAMYKQMGYTDLVAEDVEVCMCVYLFFTLNWYYLYPSTSSPSKCPYRFFILRAIICARVKECKTRAINPLRSRIRYVVSEGNRPFRRRKLSAS